jgi:uncharacterized protein (TIGR00251 family)
MAEAGKAFARNEGGRLLLDVKVTPGASRSELLDVRDGRLRVKVAAAPEDGKANAALIEFLARALCCPKREVALVSGAKSRQKTLSAPLRCYEAASALGCGR